MQLLKKANNLYKGKILILGAGVYQVPLIKKAKEMGLKTIVLSYKGNFPGFKIADKKYYVDTTDSYKVLEIAEKEKIAGVCTAGTDVPMVTSGIISDKLNLPGITRESGIFSTNKLKMKKRFKKFGVRTAGFIKVGTEEDVRNKISKLKMPVIFKAVDSSGSRGTCIVRNNKQIDEAVTAVKNTTKKSFYIVEEYLKGLEFGAQAYVYQNKIKFILPHGDLIYRSITNIPIGHFVPFKLKEDIKEDLYDQLEKAIKSLKLNNCAINADFILKDKKVFVLEIGARAGATCLAETVSIYYGFDYYRELIKSAIGKEPCFKFQSKQPNACILLFSNKSGVIKSIVNKNLNSDNIIEIKFDYGEGERVNTFCCGSDRIGHIIVKEETLKNSLNLLKKARDNISVEVE
jgi:biotin carboxylase